MVFVLGLPIFGNRGTGVLGVRTGLEKTRLVKKPWDGWIEILREILGRPQHWFRGSRILR